jgi:hypothetical protein
MAKKGNVLINGRTAVHAGSEGILVTVDVCLTKIGKPVVPIPYTPLCQDRCRLSLRDFVLSSGAKESDKNYEHQVFHRVQGQNHHQDAAAA